MTNWTNKQWGALIGAVVMFLIIIIGIEETALVALIGVLGYFIGRYLDGDFNLEDIRDRTQRRR